MIFLLLPLFFVQGCARSVLQTYPASEQEIEAAVEAFNRYRLKSEEVCGCCLDAEADAALSVSGWFSDHTGKVTGYLQAMKPGYIKYAAINVLGQPLFIFLTNGSMFKSLNVFAEKAYIGSVHSEAYRKFAPPGFAPEYSYYWLTGRLPPEDIKILAVMRDREQGNFWLQIRHAESATESMVLFDPQKRIVLRHVLRDELGKHLMDVLYADHIPLPGKESKYPGSGNELCLVPARIIVSSNSDTRKIEVALYSFLAVSRFSTEDFHLEIPDNFEQLYVK
ncbi:MAG: hypothetical protein AMJ60_00970 [Desulfobacterales bacterium SG8_35]|nr:MAG: hypothetical protein AMJ60_00970 [Desulfobacterales bacterium SG8_35]